MINYKNVATLPHSVVQWDKLDNSTSQLHSYICTYIYAYCKVQVRSRAQGPRRHLLGLPLTGTPSSRGIPSTQLACDDPVRTLNLLATVCECQTLYDFVYFCLSVSVCLSGCLSARSKCAFKIELCARTSERCVLTAPSPP